jgi:phosphatidylserine/phosphatidylglycerophosphate/cardiolipin synthase-like enzyme
MPHRIRPELLFTLVIVAALGLVEVFVTERSEPLPRSAATAKSEPYPQLTPSGTDQVAEPKQTNSTGEPIPYGPKLATESPLESPPAVASTVANAPVGPHQASRIDDQKDASYTVLFTANQHGNPEPTCVRLMCRALMSEIAHAQSSIEFAAYGFRAQNDIVQALVAAKQRGVSVRGVVDTEDAFCTKFEYADTAALFELFGPSNINCDRGPRARDIMHNKFFVFDRTSVWTGSTNISDTELGGEYHADVSVLFRSKPLAAAYSAELEEMLGGRFHRDKSDNVAHQLIVAGMPVAIYFSPTDGAIDNAVLPLIYGSAHTLDIAMFFFTSLRIADAIIAARARGVVVRMILDASGAGSRASRHRKLCEAGVAVRVETWGGKSHSKWAVSDAREQTAAVVFGSMNWTESGDLRNDENTLYVKSREFAAPFRAEFERQWDDLSSVRTCTAPSAVASPETER